MIKKDNSRCYIGICLNFLDLLEREVLEITSKQLANTTYPMNQPIINNWAAQFLEKLIQCLYLAHCNCIQNTENFDKATIVNKLVFGKQ